MKKKKCRKCGTELVNSGVSNCPECGANHPYINHIASFFGCILMLLIGWKVLHMLHIL
jgi:predicted amidophosphoribosyltransferase